MDQKKLTLQFILTQNDFLRVTTFGADSLAESTLKTFEEFAIDQTLLQTRTSEMLGLLHRAASNRHSSGRAPLDELQNLGGDLYRELIPPSLREKLQAAAGNNLLLSIEGGLINLPWELLHDGQGFFCRRYQMGRIISIPPSARRREKRRIPRPARFLSLADPRGDLDGAYQEGLQIREFLLNQDPAAVVHVLLARAVKVGDLLASLRQCDLLHYAGHLGSGENGSSLLLLDGDCSAQRLEEFAGRFPFPWLVFLNGCRSAPGEAQAFSLDHGHQRAHDLASSFLRAGARHFLGTLWDIQDSVAREGGLAFYRALFTGSSVGQALAATRQRLIEIFGESSLVWAGYLLYGDPGFSLEARGGQSSRWLGEMAGAHERRRSCREALTSSDPRERFVAAVALVQLGEGVPGDTLEKDLQVLYDLLESSSLAWRQEGSLMLEILAGSVLGFTAEGDAETRNQALARVRTFFQSSAGKARLQGKP